MRGFGFLWTVPAILDEPSELLPFPQERSDGEEGCPCWMGRHVTYLAPCSSRCAPRRLYKHGPPDCGITHERWRPGPFLS